MRDTGTISNNLPCRKCAYNLRGLKFDGRCPECGEPIRDSFAAAAAELARLLNEHPQNVVHRLKFQGIADEAGATVDAVLFVFDAIGEAHKKKPSVEMNPVAICAAVSARVKAYFNDPGEAKELLEEWGLRSGEDIGRIAAELQKHELLPNSIVIFPDDFSGQFSLDSVGTC
jgi:hypothetical protein